MFSIKVYIVFYIQYNIYIFYMHRYPEICIEMSMHWRKHPSPWHLPCYYPYTPVTYLYKLCTIPKCYLAYVCLYLCLFRCKNSIAMKEFIHRPRPLCIVLNAESRGFTARLSYTNTTLDFLESITGEISIMGFWCLVLLSLDSWACKNTVCFTFKCHCM